MIYLKFLRGYFQGDYQYINYFFIFIQVSRAFGDVEAKLSEFQGNPNVIISTPEIKSFKLNSKVDFIILGCKKINFF